jgi:D-alanine-D-alanine ligase
MPEKKGVGTTGKKVRVAILYNEPISSAESVRKYVNERGQLKEEKESAEVRLRSKSPAAVKDIDLSEVGVVEEMNDLKEALNSLGYRTTTFNVDSDIHRLYEYLRTEKPGLVFNIVECVENEAVQEMNVAGLYELLKIPYTGAGPLALGTALHKPRVKEILMYNGIRTPQFQVFRPAERIQLRSDLKFPMIVKPANEDASVGISDASVVYSAAELRKQIRYIHEEFEQPALVEEYIDGRELNAAIIGNAPPLALPISEIDFSGLTEDMHRIVSYEAKWMHGTVAYEGTQGVCPARLTAAQEAEVKSTALKCFAMFGLRDYARVDFRMTENGTLYVLEVNPNPDISDEAGFARSARAQGWTFAETVGKIVEVALERYR